MELKQILTHLDCVEPVGNIRGNRSRLLIHPPILLSAATMRRAGLAVPMGRVGVRMTRDTL